MDNLCPPECDRASEVSICLEDVTVLNPEEAEELTQSLKEVVDTEDVKPKLQCLMSNPDFSMVTVQCEDSGIHWETTSSRCSTPWASEASTTSDIYSIESSSVGTPSGKVIFIMEEGKMRRKRVRPSSSAKFSRLSSHHKKSGENGKQSADNMGESFKQALEKAKRHLSTNTGDVPTTECPTKGLEGSASLNTEEPKLDSNSENKIQEEKIESATNEDSTISTNHLPEPPNSVYKESEHTVKTSELKCDPAASETSPANNTPEKNTTEAVKQPDVQNTTNAMMSNVRVPQSLTESKTQMTSNKIDIDSYPPYVLVELSSVLENVAKICNPSKDGLEIEPPSTQSNVFSIVSDGSEILNIMAPDLISTVDQEASQEMQDKLEYLEENPLLRPKQVLDVDVMDSIPEEPDQNEVKIVEEEKILTENVINTPQPIHEIDYFEKFTLIDTKIPADVNFKTLNQEPELIHEIKGQSGPFIERQPSIEDDYYTLHNLDESFYGVHLDKDSMSQQEAGLHKTSSLDEDAEKGDLEAKKINGATIFKPDESVLAKSFFFPTSYPINPELLEEPPALAFLYADLYEEARGGKTKDEHDHSDEESTSSAATFHSRISDDDGTGIYFEKFNLKDDIPAGAVKSDEEDEFYSDEGSEEEQYLSYEILPEESSLEKSKLLAETKDTELPDPNGINTVTSLEESVSNRQNVDVPEKEAPKPLITKQRCITEEEDVDEALGYVIVSPETLDEDDVSLKELTFDDQEESLEQPGEMLVDNVQEIPPKLQESGFEIVEKETADEATKKEPETEDKKALIDTFCNTCMIPIVAIDKVFGDHQNHDVTPLENAVNLMTNNLEGLLEKLQASSMKTEEFVTKVEALFNDVERNCAEAEKLLSEENEKMVEKVLAQHKEKRESFQEVKKMKIDYLYDQMVSFQQNVDTGKEVMEKAAKDLDEPDTISFLANYNDINGRLMAAIENSISLDKMPSAFSLFDHLNEKSSEEDKKALKHVPVPQTPSLEPQEPNSATSTSITVYWTMSEEDTIDSFQVYCMEEPQGNRDDNGLLEEYRVTVKESFCILEDLEADKCYSVWVMAVNNTGCSLPSDKLIFRTAPSTPVIKAEECTVCWNTAVIRWSAARPESTETFTLEWCKQYSSEGEGLRSVSGIKDPQLRVSLLPGENYFFYVKAANTFGASEQSEAALISTKGTRFQLLRDTADTVLDLSPDGTVISIAEQKEITGIPLVLGELLPATGRHYWEVMVTECTAYSVGATFRPSPEECTQDSTSWCMQCSCTSTSFSYKFLHNEVWSEVFLTEPPVRVGILLDYTKGRLSFYNVQKGQLLFTFRHNFTEAAHPTFALEAHGEVHLHTGIELPYFARHR